MFQRIYDGDDRTNKDYTIDPSKFEPVGRRDSNLSDVNPQSSVKIKSLMSLRTQSPNEYKSRPHASEDKNAKTVNDWNRKLNHEYDQTIDVHDSLKNLSDFQTKDDIKWEMRKSAKMFQRRFKGS